MQQLKTNSLLQGGKYRIEKVLGQGGFGITYLASQELLDRKVCIKEFFYKEYCERDEATSHVTLGTQSNREVVERFMGKFIKEARTISQLNHPHIIRIHDIFRENNTAYYVMEYIEGESLAEKVNRDGKLPEAESVGYIRQVSDALGYIHGKNLLHLDIKPGNIMVDCSGQVTLIDFGLSKQYDFGGDQTSTTPVGISHGYAPMEQYNVGGVSNFSPQTDIYSLGATLYKLVTGDTPPQASGVLNEGLPALPSHLSDGVKNAIEEAMQVRKKDRPENVNAFVSLLDTGSYSFSQFSDDEKKRNEKITYRHSSEDDETVSIHEQTEEPAFSMEKINGHEAVDLGLSVLWSPVDIGSSNLLGKGDCFLWGDPDGSKTAKVQSSLWHRWMSSGPKPNNISGNPQFDTATNLWGNRWRMPNSKDFKELVNYCTWNLLNRDYVQIVGPNGAFIVLDSRWHWTGESPTGTMLPFYWTMENGEIVVFMSISSISGKSWTDFFLPIRPVANKI